MANITRAEARMDKILMGWYIHDRLLLHVWCLVEKYPSKEQETIGIDTRQSPPLLKFNPNFVNKVNMEQLETVMVSEATKLLLKHPTSRIQKPKNIASLASTVTVSELLSGINGLIFEDHPLPQVFGLDGGSYFEDYFRKLLEKAEKTNEKIKEYWNRLSDEEKKNLIENATQGDGPERDSDGYPIPSEKPMKDYTDPNGTSTQDWGPNEMMDAETKNLVDSMKGSSKMWGKYTSKHQDKIVAANTPKISCREFLRRFNNSVVSGKSVSSRMKLNRRYDLMRPGYRREYTSNIIFAIDQSGSMSDEALADGLSIINSTCRHAKIQYVLFDTEINTIVKDVRTAKKSFNRTACGGTDFQEVCTYAEKQNVDGLVILTDGYASAPNKPKNVKVFWLMLDKYQSPPVKWGFKGNLKNKG